MLIFLQAYIYVYMIYLDKGNLTKIIVTIGDASIGITYPFYYLYLTHIATNNSYFIDLGTDVSPNKERYNRFEFTAPNTLKDGQYKYIIYLSNGEALDINDNNLVKVLESGLAVLLANDTNFTTFTDNTTYYEPNI